MTERRCPVCEGRLEPRRHGWLLICGDCGFLASSLEPDIGGAAHAALNEEARGQALEPLRRATATIILDKLASVGVRKGRMLEVGPGYGWFMQAAGDRGYAVTGIEPDRDVADAARATGLDVRHGYFPDAVEPGISYDVIVFNDVLEHIPEPDAIVAAAIAALSPGGCLVVNGPSREGGLYRLADLLDRLGLHGPFERMWQKNFPSPHVSYFHPRDVARLALRSGCVEVARKALPSVHYEGLWQRLRYDRTQTPVAAGVIYVTLLAALPVLKVVPPDIRLQVFRRSV